MCGTDDDHDHDHHHDHACCSPGEDHERNLAEQRKHPLTRRQVLQSMDAAGLLITGGGISAGSAYATDPRTGVALPQSRPYAPQGADEFGRFFYISGDHHIHTRYSPDGKYAVQRQVAEANYHGLGW